VHFPDERAEIGAEDFCEGNLFETDHAHVETARPERRRHLESDEARADDYRVARLSGRSDQVAAVGNDLVGILRAAAADGIAYPLPDYQFYGNHVLIQHAGGISTVYGHMVRMNVAWGQLVTRGDLIGWVGTTGNSTGPHLHFEVRFAGVPVDPIPYLEGAPPEPFPLPAGWPGMAPDDTLGLN